jgi:hypothetical protein
VPEGDHVSVVAPAGKGKSLLVLALAVAAARGRPEFIGRGLNLTGRVLFVDMENSADDWAERLTALGVTPADVGQLAERLLALHLPPLRGLDTHRGASELLAVLDAYGIGAGDLLVLDSTQRVTEGDENSNDTIRKLYNLSGAELKRRGVTVIRTDNTGWTADHERGASAKRDDVGYSWLLLPDDRDPERFTLRQTKQRSASSGDGWFTFRRRRDGAGRLEFVPAQSGLPELLAAARDLLESLGVPEGAGVNRAWQAVRQAKDEQGDGPLFVGMTKNIIERAQAERGRSVEVVP